MTRDELIKKIELSKAANVKSKIKVVGHPKMGDMPTEGVNIMGLRAAIYKSDLSLLDVFLRIESAVCRFYHITIEQLKSRDRNYPLPLARQMFMAIARLTTGATLSTMGAHVGLSHAMVIHASKRIEELDKPWQYDFKMEMARVVQLIIRTLPGKDEADDLLPLTVGKMQELILESAGTNISEVSGSHRHLYVLTELAMAADDVGMLGQLVDAARKYIESIPNFQLKTA